MGLQLSLPLWEVLSNQTIMKQFVVLLAVCGGAFAKADADPYYAAGYAGGAGVLGYGGAIGIAAAPAVVAQRVATAPHCQTTYDTITSQQCHEEITTIVDTTTIEDCQDITEQVCTQSSVSVAHSSNVVGHTSGVAGVAAVGGAGYGAGLINHRIGKREAEADAEPEAEADAFYGAGYASGAASLVGGHTSAPNCHAETKRVCNPRNIETPRQISNPVCVSIPREVCTP